jgi:hypothetical protein
MRLAFRIDTNLTTLGAAFCVALATMTLPVDVIAQETVSAPSISVASVAVASPAPAVAAAREAATDHAADAAAATADAAAENTDTGTQALTIPADAASVNDILLDDQMLSRQRGGAAGMVMVAATPQLRGGSVTLWDEIAPPSPLPIPVDAARAAQGNVASFTRK